jgi:DNA-directed RNA polymerase subunit RPC12/RpoP
VKRFACDGCGATLAWSPDDGAMRCAHCGSARALPTAGGYVAPEYGLDREPPSAGSGLGLETEHRVCRQCGAGMEVPPGSRTGSCPFCGSHYVLAEGASAGFETPESILPLRVGPERARASYRSWIRKGWFTPGPLKVESVVDELQGFYIPAWTFDARADSRWTALRGHHDSVNQSFRDAKGLLRTRRVQKTRWEPAAGERTDRYDDVPVPAAREDVVQFLLGAGSFDTRTGLAPYRPEYLAGWSALAYTVDREAAWRQAERRIRDDQRIRCSGDVGGDTQKNLVVETTLSGIRYKLTLLPYWISSYRYRGKVFRFVVHGESGRVAGKKPISPWRVLAAVGLTVLALIVFFVVANLAR